MATELIPSPDLEEKNEDLLAAQAIARTSAGWTTALVDRHIAILEELKKLIIAGTEPPPVSPELTNANPSSPHVALLEAQAWLIAQVTRKINQLPDKVLTEFLRLHNITLLPAEAATATLKFTVSGPGGQDVTIPAGTQVTTVDDDSIIFATDTQLVILDGQTQGTVAATATTAKALALAPNTLTVMKSQVAFVIAVTNDSPVNSGKDIETIDQAKERARNRQQRASRIVSKSQYEEMIVEEVIGRQGRAKAFEFVKAGDFTGAEIPGHTTIVVQGNDGLVPDSATLTAIQAKIDAERMSGEKFYLTGPVFVAFNIDCDVKLDSVADQTTVVTAIDAALKAFYDKVKYPFGQRVARSDIIAVIEGVSGVDFISPDPTTNELLRQPTSDVSLKAWELPDLQTVTINVV